MSKLFSLSLGLLSLFALMHSAAAQPRIGAGDQFTCALGASGRAFCWGDNTSGQIGDGAGTQSPNSRVSVPVEMAGGFTQVAVGLYHSCSRMADGSAYCWGSNGYGQLGTGASSDPVNLPVRVKTTRPFAAVTTGGMWGVSGVDCNGCNNDLSGEHTCALDNAGVAFCWGANPHGQLGFGPAVVGAAASVPTAVAPPSPGAAALQFKAISAGGAHTCAIDSADDVWCWGSNVGGRAGLPNCGGGTNWSLQCDYDRPNKVTASRPAPSPALKFKAISAGTDTTCGIDTSSNVQCWGFLRGSVPPANVTPDAPSQVSLPSSAVSISVGATSACAVDTTGGLFCWGRRDHAQIGDGAAPSTGMQVTPVRVSGAQDYAAVSVGYSQACGLTTSGNVRCWGFYDSTHWGAVSVPPRIGSAFPVAVAGLRSTQLSYGGDHVCSIDSVGITSCWGDNQHGQIGHGQLPSTGGPIIVPRQSVVPTPVAHSFLTTLLRKALPESLVLEASPSKKTTGATMNFSALAVGAQHACVLSDAGRAYCWGQDAFGQVGNGNRTLVACRFGVGSANTCVPFPTIVSRAASDVFSDIAAGAAHNCARDSNKFVRCWGSAGFGELGTPITAGTTPTCANNPLRQLFCRAPVGITLPPGIRPRMVALAADDSNSCAINEAAEIWCWGILPLGKMPLTSGGPRQMPYQSGPNYVRIGLGGDFVCVGLQNGAVRCQGGNMWGQLGDGTNTPSATPTFVSGHSFAPFASGLMFSCGIEGGSVLCWGNNGFGQLGDGTTTNSNVPIQAALPAAFNAVNVGLGLGHGCAVDATGAAFCWGTNSSGELGDGNSSVVSSAPVAVAGGWKIP